MNMKKKDIELPRGGTLDLEYSDQFIMLVREWASLEPHEEVTDRHIRTYLYGAMKNAIDRDINSSS